ncbi:inner membrane transporter RhtA [Prauserella shujinwangii]|uniref:Inner membrane transporter RhtA n=2 Tax=Prauserella shujinwangii TaxID=1453103 RepID=A0A2T0M3E9_9PSEU|nr:inner membrane transporter RhtA [Prauserella shujinwangii]
MVRHHRHVDVSIPKRRIDAVPAPVLFVLSGISMYVGAAIAVWLFPAATPAGVAWLRCLGAALILLAWRRPGRAAWRGRPLLLAGAFGVVTAGMNVLFYEAIARLPLGTAVALEFAGPVAVAAFGSRGRRDVVALVLVAAGVVSIADVRLEGSPAGVAFALGAAAAWAGYILLGKRVALGGNGIDSLAVGFAVATVALSPLALGTGGIWGAPDLLVLGVGVGLLSTVVPYVLDQVVLRRVGRGRFALLLALLPVTATVTGLVVLRQVPTVPEALGILAVVAGVALRSARDT